MPSPMVILVSVPMVMSVFVPSSPTLYHALTTRLVGVMVTSRVSPSNESVSGENFSLQSSGFSAQSSSSCPSYVCSVACLAAVSKRYGPSSPILLVPLSTYTRMLPFAISGEDNVLSRTVTFVPVITSVYSPLSTPVNVAAPEMATRA